MSDDLDAIDRGILYHLQRDARAKITDIADAVGVSDNTVRNRIDRLEGRGVIEGYSVEINYGRTRSQHYYQFVCTASINDREDVAEDLLDISGVIEVRTLMTGTRNLLVTAVGETPDEITEIARQIDGTDSLTVDFEDLIRFEKRQPLEKFNLDHTQ